MSEESFDRARVLKNGELFAVLDRSGDIRAGGEHAEGLFLGDTRYLSRLELRIDGERPQLLGSTVREDNAVMIADLGTPTGREPGGAEGHAPGHIERSKFLHGGIYYERLIIHNYAQCELELELTLSFASDFRDIFEIRGMTRAGRGETVATGRSRDGLTFAYRGLDGVERRSAIRLSRAPDRIEDDVATYRIAVPRTATWDLDLVVCCGEVAAAEPCAFASYDDALARLDGEMATERRRWTSLATSSPQFNSWAARSFEDLQMLLTVTPHGSYPYAGTPWFSTVFGRDGIVTALECLWIAPHIARGVLEVLAATQADRLDAARDAEPGKVLHELRQGEMARLGEIPFGRYYGTIDATPLFVYLTGRYVERTGDLALARALWPAIDRALQWIEQYGDLDGDGYVEYGWTSDSGLRNQGWKDSDDSISHADGELAPGPLALCEVQAYVYGAYREGAQLARRLGQAAVERKLRARAAELRRAFDRDFWDDGLGTYCLALDGAKRRCRVRSSNAGHCLLTGLALPSRARAVARTLLTEDMFSGWGIRTLSAAEGRFSPVSYHNGSIWPHDNAVIAAGLARYRLQAEACRLFEAFFAASCSYELHRLPELFCGFRRRQGQGPTRYPVACRPQAWAAGAIYMFLASTLGLEIDARRGRVTLRDPILPSFIPELEIRGLGVADASIDLMFRRSGNGNDVGVEVLRRSGSVKLVVEK